ncbi:hypothetical protein [Lentisalinibacter sediminis]|uniref:hypothetical protein n=1 Tax=Lentisalinibacter sediminis TaxID=2992237 RepID=UPI0038642BF8
MPESSAEFAISLPVERSHRRWLHGYLAAVALLTAVALAAVGTGWSRLAGILPLAAGLICHRRLAACAPLPAAVSYDPARGWALSTGDETVSVTLSPASWFARGAALAVFRGDGGRRWLVPLRRPPSQSGEDWRRLRILRRTRRGALVAKSPNC